MLRCFFILLTCTLYNIFLGCSKVNKNECKNWETAILQNKTGLDGCRWVLELRSGEHLEPTNLMNFGIILKEGKKVAVSYIERNDLGSICMMGRKVDIKCIRTL